MKKYDKFADTIDDWQYRHAGAALGIMILGLVTIPLAIWFLAVK